MWGASQAELTENALALDIETSVMCYIIVWGTSGNSGQQEEEWEMNPDSGAEPDPTGPSGPQLGIWILVWIYEEVTKKFWEADFTNFF